MSQLMKDPEYREQKRTEISCKLAESGPDIASEVGLTTSQLHQLIDLETNYQIGILDTFAPASPWGQRPDPATGHAIVAEQRELKSQLDSEVIALLGTEKAQLFEAYVKAQSARRQVNALQASLVVEGSPMTPEQQKSLIATITTEQARRDSALADYRVQVKNGAVANKAVMAVLSGELDIDEQANTRIVQAATPVLSPAQLGSLQKMLAEPIARNRLHLQAHASDP
ncbi:MAG TPA: hypothetical protein VMF03_07225 [Steroidobacteraceae bacterium]|nr:hypothetical protein [Steroidobacteraceae bacterium]